MYNGKLKTLKDSVVLFIHTPHPPPQKKEMEFPWEVGGSQRPKN